jgi:hypothetical protein
MIKEPFSFFTILDAKAREERLAQEYSDRNKGENKGTYSFRKHLFRSFFRFFAPFLVKMKGFLLLQRCPCLFSDLRPEGNITHKFCRNNKEMSSIYKTDDHRLHLFY